MQYAVCTANHYYSRMSFDKWAVNKNKIGPKHNY